MGLILDTSILIAHQRGKFDLQGFLRQFPSPQPLITAVVASELLHGTERTQDPARRAWRQQQVEQIFAAMFVQPFDLDQARCHARVWADLEARGQMIGAHDLQIAAAALALGHDLATLNAGEFQRVAGLRTVDATPFRRP